MKDLHSHILMGIDDGSKNIETSIKILKKAEKDNITDIMLTPHYIKESIYNANNKEKKNILTKLQNELKKEKININLYLGNEVYADNNILKLIDDNEIMTLNNSRYILIEFPLRDRMQNDKDIIFKLITHNYIPIIAHPERYSYIQDNPSKIEEYLELGALLQGNYQSLFNKYGKQAKKTLKILIKNKQISFLGSDIHKEKDEYNIKKLEKKLLKLTKNQQEVDNLMYKNFDKVIKNEEIQ